MKDQSVLVVASDPAVVQSVRDAVHADQVRVLEAQDGSSATRILEKERASLVVVEHRPPAFDGVDVCRTIRSQGERFAEVPIVLVASEHDASLSDEAGVTDWLVKPFSAVYARTKLHAWLMRTACRWLPAPLPPNEERRLAALRELEILDTGAEERFDRIARLAAALFDVPIALVSLVDRERQWYKSHHGQDAQETSRELSFCAHAILDQEVMMVPDTLLDARFADNPLVVGEPRIRFYAGCPLLLDEDIRVGTLCLVDTRPRWLDEAKIGLLRDLARLVEQELRAAPRPAPGPIQVAP